MLVDKRDEPVGDLVIGQRARVEKDDCLGTHLATVQHRLTGTALPLAQSRRVTEEAARVSLAMDSMTIAVSLLVLIGLVALVIHLRRSIPAGP